MKKHFTPSLKALYSVFLNVQSLDSMHLAQVKIMITRDKGKIRLHGLILHCVCELFHTK